MGQRQRNHREIYFRQIDFIFRHEQEIREAVIRAKAVNYGGNEAVKLIIGNKISNPTAEQAIKNLTALAFVVIGSGVTVKQPESWLEVIDKTYAWCKRQKDCRYEVARRRYSGEDYRKTCTELNISNSTRIRLLELSEMYAALQAVQLGLIRV